MQQRKLDGLPRTRQVPRYTQCHTERIGMRNLSRIPILTPAKTLDELERNMDAIEHFEALCDQVSANRRKELAKPIPRHTCPGCFSAIYDGAAEQGWCCDCWPLRDSYTRYP